ncbi:hypothetical protein ACYOEI_26455 [Singulisphaera rosea]
MPSSSELSECERGVGGTPRLSLEVEGRGPSQRLPCEIRGQVELDPLHAHLLGIPERVSIPSPLGALDLHSHHHPQREEARQDRPKS